MLLSDNETKVDLLNNEPIAKTVIEMLKANPEQPVTIGVHGDWGAGKSSILEMIEHGLRPDEEKIVCLKFNGWRYQGFEDAKVALIEGIVHELIEKKSLWTNATEKVTALLERIDWLKVAKKAGTTLFPLVASLLTGSALPAAVAAISRAVRDPAAAMSADNARSVVDAAGDLLRPATETPLPNQIAQFRKAFDDLLEAAQIERLVVLVDDLDRCLPETAIETLEAIRLFLFTKRTAFVVAADEAMIEYAVRQHFPELEENSKSRTYSRSYLEKLIQVPVRIPRLGRIETKTYVTLLLIGAVVGESTNGFGKLLQLAKKKLQRPWVEEELTRSELRQAIGESDARWEAELQLAEQIGPTLASGTNGNPRQVKRFINALRLRVRVAASRGYASEIQISVLAKLMLAERFQPKLFEHIVQEAERSSDGKLSIFSALEALQSPLRRDEPAEVDVQNRTLASAKPSTDPAKRSEPLAQWLQEPSVLGWSATPPSFAEVDLRPYLFITRDTKDYLGGHQGLGHLQPVFEQLLAGGMVAANAQSELGGLKLDEVRKLFGRLLEHASAANNWGAAPAALSGIRALVKIHKAIEPELIDWLKDLPIPVLGPWVVNGWSGLESREEFRRLLRRWADEGTQLLKTAATRQLKS